MPSPFDPAEYGNHAASFYDQLYGGVETGLLAALVDLAGGGPALDLGIGTGRLAIPLRRVGVPVGGVEASPAMIAAFRARPGTEDIPVIEGDFASTPLGGPYQLIYSLASTFFLLPSLDLQRACLENVARHLLPAGVFVSEGFSAASGSPLLESNDYPISTSSGVQTYRVTVLATPLSVLDPMARACGLSLTARWSNWFRARYIPDQPRHISVYTLE